MSTVTHESTTCNRDAGRACAMCRWVNKRRGLIECPSCFEWVDVKDMHVCGVRAAQPDLHLPDYIHDIRARNEASGLREFFGSEFGRRESEQAEIEAVGDTADNLTPPPNFESAWATAPPEYSRYTEETHALYWYLRGMQDEQRITRLARRTLAREDVEEMGRLAQVRREG